MTPLSRRFFSYLPVALLTVCLVAAASTADEWTNLRGTSSVFAKLIGVWNGRALLKLEDGRQVSVKLDDLNADSRIRAQNQQAEIDQSMRARVSELDKLATAAAAPMPATLPAISPTPKYIPPAEGEDLRTTLQEIQTQAQAGHLRVYYDTLPKSYQAKADELFKLALTKLDADSYERFRSTMQRLSELTITRQRWLFSHPKFESLNDTETVMAIASAFRQWGTEENASLEALQNQPLGDVLTKLDAATASHLNAVIDRIFVFPSYEIETLQNGTTMAKVVLPFIGNVHSFPMVQIEGRWIEGATPEEALAKWDGYKQTLEQIPDRSLRLGNEAEAALDAVTSILPPLERATNKNAFHRVIDEVLVSLRPALNLWAGVKPITINGYGDSSEMMEGDYSDSQDSEAAQRRQQ